MNDPFENRSLPLSGPATDIVPVTPDDNQNLSDVAVALYVEGAGVVSIVTVRDQTRLVDVAAHSILPVGVRRVNATGTTAQNIFAMVVA